MKLALAPLALVVGLSLTACGSDDAGESASGSESTSPSAGTSAAAGGAGPFCDALAATATVQDGQDVADLRESLEATGLPEEAGEDAQAGLAVYIDILDRVDEDATAKDLAKMEDPGLSQEEQAEVDAMVSYATTACAAGAGQDPEAPESPESDPEAPESEPAE